MPDSPSSVAPFRAGRHTRQVRLCEIAEEGQRRLAASAHIVRATGTRGEVHARYLAGAGVRTISVANEAIAAVTRAVDGEVEVAVADGVGVVVGVAVGVGVTAGGLRPSSWTSLYCASLRTVPFEVARDASPAWADELDPAAREVAVGAYRALAAVRSVVLAPSEPHPSTRAG